MAEATILSDVGGTNARFGVLRPDGDFDETAVLSVADHADFESALAVYLARTGVVPARFAISAAGPAVGDEIRLTNAPWTISATALSARFDGARVDIVNDLHAVALALPGLRKRDTAQVLAPAAEVPGPRLAVNLGTGFGAAVALPVEGDRWEVLPTEAGHVRLDPGPFAASGARTVEDLFSGPGLARARAAPVDLAPGAWRRAYSRLLGRVVADLVLATGAWGGVFLCGGLTDDFAALIDRNGFRNGFREEGPMQIRLKQVPVRRIALEVPAFRGLKRLVTAG